MATIVCRKLSFAYDGAARNIFEDLDLLVDTGCRTALTGRNGRGKTTLLRLIHGDLQPDKGGIERSIDTRRFPVAVADPAVSAFAAAKDAAGPFRLWEGEMSRLLDAGLDESTLNRYGALQSRFQEVGGYSIDADLESELGARDDRRAARVVKRAIVAEARAGREIEARRQTLVDSERSYRLKLRTRVAPRGRRLAIAENLVLVRGQPLFAPVSFQVCPGDRIAVVGPNGSGKTSLLELIAGEPHRHLGTFSCPARFGIARVRQQPRWTAGLLAQHLADGGVDQTRFRQVMAALGVRGDTLDRPIESMSPGQQKKVELAGSFVASSDLLLWDEPLNYLDIDAREAIEDVVLRDAPTLVFVEHDAAFVTRVATQVVELLPG